ncbi:MAG: hypothetical protein VB058_05415 [Oscillospiraceae bacterium]|nr:hypothetical protein [Oscillospiraceae bacterium]
MVDRTFFGKVYAFPLLAAASTTADIPFPEIANMTHEDLTCALNVSFVTINRRENGKTPPNKLTQNAFYDFLSATGIECRKLESAMAVQYICCIIMV